MRVCVPGRGGGEGQEQLKGVQQWGTSKDGFVVAQYAIVLEAISLRMGLVYVAGGGEVHRESEMHRAR